MSRKFKYLVQINWSPGDGCYVVRVPELPGCITDGSTYAEAAAMAEDAIESYVSALVAEGAQIPVPLSELEFSGKLNVRLGSELHRDIAAKAAAENKSINDILLEAASSFLTSQEKSFREKQKRLGFQKKHAGTPKSISRAKAPRAAKKKSS
jgi:antitoxin HicB